MPSVSEAGDDMVVDSESNEVGPVSRYTTTRMRIGKPNGIVIQIMQCRSVSGASFFVLIGGHSLLVFLC